MNEPQWLTWANRLRAIAQAGLTYTEGPFDRERYEQLLDVSAEIFAAHTEVDYETIHDLIDGDVGYPTPKVDVRGAVFNADGQILLVQEALDDDKWTLPGGWADIYDTPAESVAREVVEESGFEVEVVKLIAVYDRQKWGHEPHPNYTYKLFFLCEITGGAPRLSIETNGIDWFDVRNLPELSPGRTLPEQIRRCHAHWLERGLPTEYD